VPTQAKGKNSMRIMIGLLTCLCMGEWSQALATDPPSQAPASVQSGQAPPAATSAAAPSAAAPAAPAASSSSAASASAAITPAKPAADADADDKYLRQQGYKREVRNGQTYYCRSEIVVGSRFQNKVCGSSEQLTSARRQAQANVSKAQQSYVPGSLVGK
jgi:hypothetical protein